MKNLICAITQPHYLPWKGYFNLINRVDLFIYLDDVKYIKREWKNRNKIRKSFSSNDYKWISIPIDKVNQNKYLNKCKVYDDLNWRVEHLNQINQVYNKAPYFNLYFENISKIISDKNLIILSEINIKLIDYFCNILQINTKRIKSSSLKSAASKDYKLLDLCKKISATKYIANNKSSDYINDKIFLDNNIKFEYQNFSPNKYDQFYDKKKLNEIKFLSILDLIFNHGNDSKSFIV